jgi:asparagine synthetase B (glutamine-hydrolysing)
MEFKESVDETRVVGRELSQKTFSGKKIDYNIPEIKSIPSSLIHVKEALKLSMQDYDDVALLLSGGKDSRMLAVLLKVLKKDVTCYTYIGRHNKYEENELKVAKRVAERLGFSHKVLELNWKNFYDRDTIPNIIKATDGTPIFHTVLTMANIRPGIPQKHLITGDLVTELLDTAEYRPWKDGKEGKVVLFNREKTIVKTDDDKRIVAKLRAMYDAHSLEEMLLLRKTDRIVRAQVYKKLGFKVIHPALDNNVLNHTFSLPLKDRTDGKLMRRIIKRTNPELYKYRTARSPLSLRYPLSVHMAYGKIMGTGVNNTPIQGSFNEKNKKIVDKEEKYRNDNYLWWRHVLGNG